MASDEGLPRGLLVGGWWTASGRPVEIDVLGLAGNRTALIGEATWSPRPDWIRLAVDLEPKLAAAPTPLPEVRRLLWVGADPDPAALPGDVTALGPADVTSRRQREVDRHAAYSQSTKAGG